MSTQLTVDGGEQFPVQHWRENKGIIKTPGWKARIHIDAIRPKGRHLELGGRLVTDVVLGTTPDGLEVVSATVVGGIPTPEPKVAPAKPKAPKVPKPTPKITLDALRKFKVGDTIRITFRKSIAMDQLQGFLGMCLSTEPLFEVSAAQIADLGHVISSSSWYNTWRHVTATIKRWDPERDIEDWFLYLLESGLEEIVKL